MIERENVIGDIGMYEIIYALKWKWWMLKTRTFYRIFFGHIGTRSTICKPMYIAHPENMYLGNHVRIREFARLETEVKYNNQILHPKLEIGNDVGFEQGLHLTCGESIKIGNDVTVLPYVMITDCEHEYQDLNTNVIDQKLKTTPVVIGDGCFIGLGARIFPGTTLGEHCVVGTNAVVRGGVYSAYSIIVGVPARVVKRYDTNLKIWKKTDCEGVFIE